MTFYLRTLLLAFASLGFASSSAFADMITWEYAGLGTLYTQPFPSPSVPVETRDVTLSVSIDPTAANLIGSSICASLPPDQFGFYHYHYPFTFTFGDYSYSSPSQGGLLQVNFDAALNPFCQANPTRDIRLLLGPSSSVYPWLVDAFFPMPEGSGAIPLEAPARGSGTFYSASNAFPEAPGGFIEFGVTPTPEPTSMLLLGTGLLGVIGRTWRRRRTRDGIRRTR